MPKIGFPMPTAKNRFQILNLHPKKYLLKKNMVLKEKNYRKTIISIKTNVRTVEALDFLRID